MSNINDKTVKEKNITNDKNKPQDVNTGNPAKKNKMKKEYDFVGELKKDMVEIKIPIDPLNKHLKTEDVFINGYRWTIERGKNVKVPKAVKEVLENAGII